VLTLQLTLYICNALHSVIIEPPLLRTSWGLVKLYYIQYVHSVLLTPTVDTSDIEQARTRISNVCTNTNYTIFSH